MLDVCTHFKPTETFQYTHFTSCHAPSVRKGFIKGEALRLLRTNSSEKLYEDNIKKFKTRLCERGYPDNLINNILGEIRFEERKSALQEKQKMRKDILPFVTQYNPAVLPAWLSREFRLWNGFDSDVEIFMSRTLCINYYTVFQMPHPPCLHFT